LIPGYGASPGPHSRCMTLPQPAGGRLLPRSPYGLRPRGRESTACWQVLRFAACFTRPDGTSARVHRQPDPVETTHPHGIRTAVRSTHPFYPEGLRMPTRRCRNGPARPLQPEARRGSAAVVSTGGRSMRSQEPRSEVASEVFPWPTS
jgi:hypothetical protein